MIHLSRTQSDGHIIVQDGPGKKVWLCTRKSGEKYLSTHSSLCHIPHSLIVPSGKHVTQGSHSELFHGIYIYWNGDVKSPILIWRLLARVSLDWFVQQCSLLPLPKERNRARHRKNLCQSTKWVLATLFWGLHESPYRWTPNLTFSGDLSP